MSHEANHNRNVERNVEPVRTGVCQICQQAKPLSALIPAALIRPALIERIYKSHPEWDPLGFICADDLNYYRGEYCQDVLEAEKGELSALDAQVIRSLQEHEILARNINAEFERRSTVAERVSDKVAEFGGSWRFILSFGAVFLAWITLNSIPFWGGYKPFDPFPYILLNLVLSGLAGIQAPIIMMSQNRQEQKDRLRAENDYRVNLKAELEIRHLNEKVDHLLKIQWQRLLEIQHIQTELIEEIAQRLPPLPRAAPDEMNKE